MHTFMKVVRGINYVCYIRIEYVMMMCGRFFIISTKINGYEMCASVCVVRFHGWHDVSTNGIN